jgi:hypothetical protein
MLFAAVLAFTSSAAAGTISIAWDPNPEPNVMGYVVYVGNSPGNYTAMYDVGNATTFDFANAVPGATYHMAVQAYASATNVSPLSANLSITLSAVPTVPTNLAPANTTTSVTPTYTWSAVPNATSYFLWVNDTQQNGRIRQIYSAAEVACTAGTGTCAITPSVALTTGAANWGVMAASAAGDGPWSATSAFTVAGTASADTSLTIVPHAGWKVKFVDSQDSAAYAATNAFDDNPATIWHTQWATGSPLPPHELQIDLGTTYALGGLRYLPRQDGNTNGNIAKYEIYVSADGANWSTAVASGTFASGSAEQQISFTATSGRYIRLRALSEVGGRAWTNVAELNVLAKSQTVSASVLSHSGWSVRYVDSQDGSSYDAKNAIDGDPATMWHSQWSGSSPLPPHELQVDLGSSYTLSGFRYLPRQDGKTNGNIAKYEFYVSGDGVNWGTAVATGTLAGGSAEQQVTFPTTSGRYIRLRALSEISGLPWTNVAELNLLGQAQAGQPQTNPIPRTAWTLHFVDSQDTQGGLYGATNAFDGNPGTMWHTQWSTGSPLPPHELQINLGASYPVSGFRYLPRQDGQPYGNIARYEFYVSTDGANWGTAVASGTFAAGSSEQQVTFTAKTGRYVRLRALSETQGYAWTAVSELQVLQTVP